MVHKNHEGDPEDVELASYRELKRIADALEKLTELLSMATSTPDSGFGLALDVQVLK